MKLLQFNLPGRGRRAGVLEGAEVVDLTSADPELRSVLDVLNRSVSAGKVVEDVVREVRPLAADVYAFADLNVSPSQANPHLDMPICAPEVWGFGVTYKRSAMDRDADSASDIYTRVYFGERPEVFFKATPPRCVGPNRAIAIRRDSNLTAVEPELAFVLGANGQIVGYTICNDVSAWDI